MNEIILKVPGGYRLWQGEDARKAHEIACHEFNEAVKAFLDQALPAGWRQHIMLTTYADGWTIKGTDGGRRTFCRMKIGSNYTITAKHVAEMQQVVESKIKAEAAREASRDRYRQTVDLVRTVLANWYQKGVTLEWTVDFNQHHLKLSFAIERIGQDSGLSYRYRCSIYRDGTISPVTNAENIRIESVGEAERYIQKHIANAVNVGAWARSIKAVLPAEYFDRKGEQDNGR